MAIADKVLLRFTKFCAPYNAGELAQLPRDAALRVISAGSAVAASKDAPDEPDAEVMREVQAMHRAELLHMGIDPDTIARCIAMGVGPLEAARVTVAGLNAELNRREQKAAAAQPEPETVTDENPADQSSADTGGNGGDGGSPETGSGRRKK